MILDSLDNPFTPSQYRLAAALLDAYDASTKGGRETATDAQVAAVSALWHENMTHDRLICQHQTMTHIAWDALTSIAAIEGHDLGHYLMQIEDLAVEAEGDPRL